MNITALSLSLEEDLAPLSGFLYQQGVRHRVYEEDGRQVLAVESQEVRDQVCTLYERWRAGEVKIERVAQQAPATASPGLQLQHVPVTLGLIVLSVAGFLIYLFSMVPLLSLFTFTDFEMVGGRLRFLPHEGEYWRLLTPIFLHFGWLHIAFNSLWVWEIGSRIERRLGSPFLVFLVLVIGLGSNTAQYLYTGPVLFGGMSGVVYGFFGFCWVLSALRPDSGLALPQGILIFMLVWLVFCMVGPTELLSSGSVANAAHVVGLLLGCVAAAIHSLVTERGD